MKKEVIIELHNLATKEEKSIKRALKRTTDIDLVNRAQLENKLDLYDEIKKSLLSELLKITKNESKK